jgi:hypothetical protein
MQTKKATLTESRGEITTEFFRKTTRVTVRPKLDSKPTAILTSFTESDGRHRFDLRVAVKPRTIKASGTEQRDSVALQQAVESLEALLGLLKQAQQPVELVAVPVVALMHVPRFDRDGKVATREDLIAQAQDTLDEQVRSGNMAWLSEPAAHSDIDEAVLDLEERLDEDGTIDRVPYHSEGLLTKASRALDAEVRSQQANAAQDDAIGDALDALKPQTPTIEALKRIGGTALVSEDDL